MKLVIFDIDGTLLDSKKMIFTAFKMASEKHNVKVPKKPAILKGVGLSLPEAVRDLYPSLPENMCLSIAQSYKDAFIRLRASKTDCLLTSLFPGVLETLKILASYSDFQLALATGKSKSGVDNDLKIHNILSFFHNIQTSDDHPSKPDPAMLISLLAETGIPVSSTIMIGDTSFDMKMAKSINVMTIGVSWGYHSVEELVNSGADFIIDSMYELEKTLNLAFAKGQT